MIRNCGHASLSCRTIRCTSARLPAAALLISLAALAMGDALGLARRSMLDALREFYATSYTNVHRGVYLLAERATERFEGARERSMLAARQHARRDQEQHAALRERARHQRVQAGHQFLPVERLGDIFVGAGADAERDAQIFRRHHLRRIGGHRRLPARGLGTPVRGPRQLWARIGPGAGGHRHRQPPRKRDAARKQAELLDSMPHCKA